MSQVEGAGSNHLLTDQMNHENMISDHTDLANQSHTNGAKHNPHLSERPPASIQCHFTAQPDTNKQIIIPYLDKYDILQGFNSNRDEGVTLDR